jgi:dephospho-CoA kinase
MKNAIFLVGGPGSGKDLIIKESLVRHNVKEYNIEQIKNIKLFEENVVITANAYSFDKIKETQSIFENLKYNTFMIYVDVCNEVSKERLSNRDIDETVRITRLLESKENLNKFKSIFQTVYTFDNSYLLESDDIQNQLYSINKQLDIEIFSNNLELFAEVEIDPFINRFRNTLFEGTKGLYNNFKQDKETKKEKKYDKQEIMNNIIPKNGLGPTYDTRETGDTSLIKSYNFAKEAIDSPNAADTGLMGGVQNQPQVGDVVSHQISQFYSQKKNPNRMKNFEKDQDTDSGKQLPKRIKKILFKG